MAGVDRINKCEREGEFKIIDIRPKGNVRKHLFCSEWLESGIYLNMVMEVWFNHDFPN